jgi:integrase/recombinase XerD
MTRQNLETHIDRYLALRSAFGFHLRNDRTVLHSFVGYVTERNSGAPIRAHLAVEWACTAGSRGQRTAPVQRLSVVRRFLIYLQAHDPATEVPAHHVVAGTRRRSPYLFTPVQIVALMQAARQTGPQDSLRPQTLSTLIGVLASTGVRVGEALRLRVNDVQLNADPPRLLIEQTKFQKSRWVPLHPTTATQLRNYQAQRAQHFARPDTNRFFLSATGHPLHGGSVQTWFSKTCQRLGFWPTGNTRRPCLQCLRHTFAVQRLQRWYEEGADVARLLAHLSVYLGHVRPQESYWYLTATADVLMPAAGRFHAYTQNGGGQ